MAAERDGRNTDTRVNARARPLADGWRTANNRAGQSQGDDRARLKAAMGRVSRQIGEARQRGDDVQHLVAEMRHLSEGSRPLATDEEISITRATATAAEWDAYVKAHPRASLYHRFCWRSIIQSAFGHEAPYLEARDTSGRLRGVLPLVRQRSRLFGDYLVSIPFVNYGGAIADSVELEARLMQQAGELARNVGARHVEFRDPLERAGWPFRADKVSLRLSLPGASDELWKRFTSKLRAQIRRAEREGPETRVGGCELVPDFYAVFARTMRDLGTPVYSRRFFQTILGQLSGYGRVVVVYLRGRPAAAAMLLGDGHTLEIPWAASLRELNPLAVNMVLYWRVLQHAIESGHQTFDFGRSTEGSGTYRFKRQWGAEPVPLYWHYWLSDGTELPRLNPDNPRYQLAIAAWQRLPLWMANAIGPRLVRNLP
jgi:serine/alanine adding enzyme